MRTALYQHRNAIVTKHQNSDIFDEGQAQLVLCFGAKKLFQNTATYTELREKYPLADMVMCSTAGEIFNNEVFDDSISVAVIQLEKTKIKAESVKIEDYDNSYAAGVSMIGKFSTDNLAYLLVLSDGSKVNGSELVRGLNNGAKKNLPVTGGLAGDGSNFQSTLVGLNEQPVEGLIVGIGFYGNDIQVNHGSKGGWETFGLEKQVTKSVSNVLYEINNQNALELYFRDRHYCFPCQLHYPVRGKLLFVPFYQ